MSGTNQNSVNKVTIEGAVADDAVLSHELFGEAFYHVNIKVQRLSSVFDILPVMYSERLLRDPLKEGDRVRITGQFRSHNKFIEEKSKLILTVFVREFVDLTGIDTNTVELSGSICKTPIYRTTPFSREICDILLAVNRAYSKSDYIPCIAWGRNARFVRYLEVGEGISVFGRIQSRIYQKRIDDDTCEDRTAYEVSTSKIVMFEPVQGDDDMVLPEVKTV
jgi:single-stranded DNA-binding protein